MIQNINNIEIWIDTYGSDKDNCIVLISGAMSPASFWNDDFCKFLAKHSFVIRFDNRDYGYSTHFNEQDPPPYSIDDMVEDVRDILDFYLVESTHVIGHSLGGSIAQLFAIKYPHRTKYLIPISSQSIQNENWQKKPPHTKEKAK